MIKEWNILILQSMLKDENISPLKRYFVWEMLNKKIVENQIKK